MMQQTLHDWRAEAVQRFGESRLCWRFVCPACGKKYAIGEYVGAGGDMQRAYQECIGRVNGNIETSPKDGAEHGCNWAAYGLLGTMGKGRIVITQEGDKVEVFDFAPESSLQ